MTLNRQSKRGEWHEAARIIHAANPDWSHGRIAEVLGVTSSAVLKVLNPERAREYRRRSEAQPGRYEAKRAWDRTAKARGNCPRCGALKGIGTAHQSELCRPCEFAKRAEVHDVRLSLVEGMWNDGWLIREISEALGYLTRGGACPDLDELRKAGRIAYRRAWAAERAAA